MTSSVITRMPRSCAPLEKRLEIVELSVLRMDARVVGDVVAVVLQRRRIKRQQPDRGDPQILKVIELLGQPAKVADARRPSLSKNARTWTS